MQRPGCDRSSATRPWATSNARKVFSDRKVLQEPSLPRGSCAHGERDRLRADMLAGSWLHGLEKALSRKLVHFLDGAGAV